MRGDSSRKVLAFGVLAAFASTPSAEAQSGRGRPRAARTPPAARGAGLSAEWVGQAGEDRVGPGLAVGPDGFVDAKVILRGLSGEAPIVGVVVKAAGGGEWHTGVNPDAKTSAELVRRGDDPAVGDLFRAPARDLKGQVVTFAVHYANAKIATARLTAGGVDPKLAIPRPKLESPKVLKLTATWLGQDGTDRVGPGDVHVALEGLPRGAIAAAALSDRSRGLWSVKFREAPPFDPGADSVPMALDRGPDPTKADLRFPPFRDETGGTMTLRLLFEDGHAEVAEFPGGACDPGLRSPARPDASSADAKPGDDLHALVKAHGTVRLAPGRYRLNRPLVLDKPITILGPGATLAFSQPGGDPTWPAAIKVHWGHTTLEGFAVRFDGPIRWTPNVDNGPAVIGTTDNTDTGPVDIKADLTFRKLDLEGPPAATDWEEAPRLLRMGRGLCGAIEGNTLKGGMVEVEGGPWRIVGNRYLGTPEGTFCYGVIGAHHSHDLLVKGNVARPAAGGRSKTWRFLVLTRSGTDDVIEGNEVAGLGPRDGDTVPANNAPEIILTEAYNLHFEGRPSAVSPDGRVVALTTLQGSPARTGDALAILSGPHAGQWRTIAQAMGPTTYLLGEPLPPGSADHAVSIATGFVRETFRKNTIDARGSSGAGCLVLVGNHFGLTVAENHILGGHAAFKITAAPTENPVHWGWSHAPLMGATISGNLLEDSLRGGVVCVEHSPQIKTTRGRVYASVVLSGNTAKLSREFAAKAATRRPSAFVLGDEGSFDPGEMLVSEGGNRSGGPSPIEGRIVAARVNGRDHRERSISLPPERTASPGPAGGARR